MRLTAQGARAWRARSRAGVALLVLTAWFGTLLVAAPTLAQAGTPGPTITAGPTTSPDTDDTPTWTFDVGPTTTTPDVTTTPSDTTTVTITVEHAAKCAVATSAPSSAGDYTDCGTSNTSSGVLSFTPPALSAGDYVFYVHDVRTTTTTTTIEYVDGSPTSGPTDDVQVDTSDDSASSPYSYAPPPPPGPVLTLDAGPASATSNDPSPSWTVTSDGGEQVTCSLAHNGGAPGLSGRCDLGGYPAAPLPSDGTWVLSATATNGTITTEPALATYVLDRQVPTITIDPVDATTAARPSWDVSSDEPSADPTCRLTGTVTATGGSYDSGVAVACGTPYSPAADLDEGTYTLTATATDSAGNAATPATQNYTYDITDPGSPVLTGATGRVGPPSFTWHIAAADADTSRIDCLVTSPGGSPVAYPSCIGDLTISPTQAQQGGWTLTATAFDANGNSSATPSTRTVTYDSVISATQVVRNGGPTTAPVWHVTVDADATATCSVAGVQTATPCTNTDFTMNLAGKPGAVYTLVVTAVDSVGNTAASVSVDYVLAPPAPSVSVTGQGSSRTPSWSISGQSDATLTCTLVSPSAARTAVTPCQNGTITPTLTGADGVWKLEVVATIPTGGSTTVDSQVGTTPSGYRLDTTAPGDPTISATPAGPQNSSIVHWSVTAAAVGVDPGPTTNVVCDVYFTPAVTGIQGLNRTIPACQTTGVDLSFAVTDEGTWQAKATAYDAVGNTSNIVSGPIVTYDITAPAAPDILPLTSPSNDPSPTWTINHAIGTSLECAWTTGAAVPQPSDWFACDSPAVIPVPQPGDDTYILHARATDLADNTGSEDTQAYELDRSAPLAPTFSTPTSPSASASVSWTIGSGGEISPTLECRLLQDDGSGTFVPVAGFGWSACTTTTTYAVATLPVEGAYEVQSRVTDRAGNLGAPGTSTPYVYDKTPPAIPTVNGPTGPSKTRNVTWTITKSAAPDTLECRYVDNGTVVTAFASCGTTVTRLSLADGTYALQVQEIDGAGNRSTPVAVSPTYVIDNAGPAAPTFSGTAGTGNTASTNWAFSGEAGASPSCTLLYNNAAQSAPAACASGDSFGLTAGDGSYQVEVFYTDVAGNPGTPAKSAIYLLDRQAPAAPDLHGPSTTANTTTGSYTFTAEAASVAACRLLFTPAGSVAPPAPIGAGAFVPCTSPWNVSYTQGDGSYQAEVHVTDAAGNVSLDAQSEVYTLDTTGPLAPSFTAEPTGTANVKPVTFTWSGETPSTGVCTLRRTPVGSSTAAIVDGPVACDAGSYAQTLSYGDGFYKLFVQLTDPYSNVGAVGVSTGYNLDATPPSAPTVVGPTGTSNNTTADYSITSTVEALATEECMLTRDGTVVVSDWGPCTLPSSITLVGDGSYVLRVRLTDQYGNLGAAGASPAYLLDTQAPAQPVMHGPTGTANTTTASYTFTAEAGSAAVCRLLFSSTGAPAPIGAGGFAACTSPWSQSLTQGDGDYEAEVHVTDAAGNVSPDAQSEVYTLDTTGPLAPTFTAEPTGTANVKPVTFTWSGETPSTGVCTLRRTPVGSSTAAIVDGPVACDSGSYAQTLSYGDGFYQLSVRLTDPYSNAGGLAVSTGYNLDATPPAAPTVTGPTGTNNNTTASYDISSTVEALATEECKLTRDGTVVVSDWSPCTLPSSITLSGEGSYVLQVRLTDQYGNLGLPGASPAYLLDTIAPAMPDLHGPTGRANTASASYTFTAEAASAAVCRLLFSSTGAPAPIGAGTWATCTSPWSQSLTQGDGDYQAEVHVTDAAGNVSPDAQSEVYTLDTTGPLAPTFTAEPTGTANVKAVTFTWSGETPSTGSCTLRRTPVGSSTAAIVDGPVACDSGSYAQTLSYGDGFYQLSVRLTDPYNNAGVVAVSTGYNLDATPPPAPTVAGPTGTSNDTTADYSITSTVEALATEECKLSRDGTVVVSDWGPCTLPSSITLVGDGSYVLQVRLTDQYGNLGAAGASPGFLLDTQAPALPVIHGPTGRAKTTSASYTFTAEPASAAVCRQLFVADGSTGTPAPIGAGTWTPCTSPWGALLGQGDGDYQAEVHVTDAAGNVSPDAQSEIYTLDTTGPLAPTFTAQPTGTANVKAVTFTWSGETPSTGVCTLRRTPVGSFTPAIVDGPVACDSGSYATTLTYGDGFYQLAVQLTDPYNNAGGLAVSTGYNLDATPPPAPTVTGPTGTSNDTTADYSLTSTVEALATEQCRLTLDGAVVSDWSSCTLPRTIALAGDGIYVLQVRLTDQYGNQGPAGASAPFLLDTKLPTVPVVTAPGSPSANSAPSFAIQTDADTTTTCKLFRGSIVAVDTTACAGSFTANLVGMPDGDYVLSVSATDPAGNVATGTSATYTFDTTKPIAPLVTGPAGPSQSRNPVFSWIGEAGAHAICSLQEKVGTAGPWTSCVTPFAPTLPADGSWVLSVRLTDAAGNISDPGASGAYIFDTTAPSTPLVTAPPSPGRDLSPSWSATTEEGSRTECRLTGPGQSGSWVPCVLPLATPVSADGAYTLDVRATDAAGNISAVGSGVYVLDTTAPVAPVVAQPSGPGRTRAPSISFASEAGTTGSCRLTHGATVLSDSAVCSSPVTLDLSGVNDGAYTLSVRAVDAAGNIGPAGTATYVLDTTPPTAPTFTLVAGSPSSDRAPVFGFNAELGTTLGCRVTAPNGTVHDLSCTSQLTLDLSGATDGDYGVAVRATDLAGNVGPAATTTYQLDSTAPVAPKIVGPPTPGSVRNPVWKISSSNPAECRLTRGTNIVKDWAPCGSSYAADLFSQPDGSYILEARVIGTTAPTSSRYRLDTTGPGAATLVGPPSPSTDRRPTWAISSIDSTVKAECRVLVFTGVLRDWSACSVSLAGSLYTLDLSGLGDGTYSLVVRLTDAAGNVGPTATSAYVLDTSAPAAVGVVAPTSPGNDTTPTWTLTSATGVKLECRLSSGQKVISDFAPCGGTFTADLTGLPDGTYTLTVHALSAAGTPGPDTTSGYILDTTAAGAPGTLSGPTGPSRDRAPKWTFTLAPGTTATCKVTVGGRVVRDGPCTSPFVLDLSNAADGTYTLTVRAIDAAGNLGSPSTAAYILKTTPPPAPALTMRPGSPSSTTDPRWGFSLFRGTTGQCRLLQAGSALEDWTACTTPVTALLSGKPDGTYTMQFRAIDVALNTSAAVSDEYVFDRAASPLAQFSATPSTPGNDTTPTWIIAAPPTVTTSTGTAGTAGLIRAAALAGSTETECRLTTSHGVGSWAPCSGNYTASTNGDGTYILESRAFDSTGERGPVSSSTYQLDTRAPAAPRFVEPLPPPVGNDAEVVWSWAEDDSLVQCHLFRAAVSLGAFATCDPPYVANVGRFGEATYSIEARAVDAAGNVGPVTVASYRYDITPPPTPVFSTRPAGHGSSASVTWTFAVPVDTSAVCVVSRNGTVISEGACAGAFSLDLRGQQPATWTLSVHLVDAAGNAGRSAVGTYTLTSAIGRGRTDGSGGFDNGGGSPRVPGAGAAPRAGSSHSNGPDGLNDHPKLGPIPRIADVIKKGAKGLERAAAAIPGALPGTDVPRAIKNVLGQTITKPQLPLALFIIVLLFLLVQNRIDRRDPKLAAAPVNAEPELTFGPVLRPGGSTA